MYSVHVCCVQCMDMEGGLVVWGGGASLFFIIVVVIPAVAICIYAFNCYNRTCLVHMYMYIATKSFLKT